MRTWGDLKEAGPEWPASQAFHAYGVRFGVRTTDIAVLAAASTAIPLVWQPVASGDVDVLYSLRCTSPNQGAAQCDEYVLLCGTTPVANGSDLASVLAAFHQHAELLTAVRVQQMLFVHAGVVGWRGKAILLPGRSFAGKTTLVKALVEAGATYYSDEFAILDQQGHVAPYPRPLALRNQAGNHVGALPATALGGTTGTEPLPVGLVVVTQYVPGAAWRPRALTAGKILLALMDNTVAAQRDPGSTMPFLRVVANSAPGIQSRRGNATAVARALLHRLSC